MEQTANLMNIVDAIRKTFLVGFFAVFSCSSALSADDTAWGDVAYPYTIVDQDVQEALAELGRNLNIGIDMSEAVEGRLRGPWSSSTVEDFMNRVSDDLDVEWFFDGRRLHVSSTAESVRHLLPLGGVEPDAWQASLDKLGISNERFPVTVDPAQNVALVSGPPKFVALVVQSLPKTAAPARAGRVNVIYGRNSRGDAS